MAFCMIAPGHYLGQYCRHMASPGHTLLHPSKLPVSGSFQGCEDKIRLIYLKSLRIQTIKISHDDY